MRYVIVGGGIAGTTAAEELRKADAEAEITIIGQEEHSCYSRVLLPHYVKGVTTRDKVFVKQDAWYLAQRIEYLRGTLVTAIDTKNKFVAIHTGREIEYDKLLLAIGGELNLAAGDVRGVCYLSTLEDADGILARMREVRLLPKDEQRAVVQGGGFIALEFINIFAHFGLPTTVLLRGDGFWSRTLSAHAKAVLAAHATAHGVTLITGQDGAVPIGTDEVKHVVLHDGAQIPAAIMGVGLGIHPDTALLAASGVDVNRGVCANAFLETSVPDVYTAGDATEFDHPVLGRRLQVGNWFNAQMQARAVAKTMRGERTEYALVTSYATQLLGLHIVFAGDTNHEYADE
ncbi:FAD-dependent oxidoreductase, partial [Candidatus Uhrbacteria bacterium]|nr:FAD-dependent oxidoreductase [Candidatus Uhrbacteria bacterium]